MAGDGETARWRVPPGTKVKLGDHKPDDLAGAPGDRAATEEATRELVAKLADLQERLWAESKQALLVVLQAMDAGGKDGTIKTVFDGVNPQGCRVAGFKEPTPIELAHDFLWRVHQAAPKHGEIGIFNRSHYEDVLIVRVHDIVKFFLHISKDEQAKRFQKRLESPSKRWKFRKGDLVERKLWDDYQRAYADALSETSTDEAPWYIVPADHKWFRTWVVSTVLVDTLERMNPTFPEPEEDLDGLIIE
jgi:polyphosphate kinase 2 (PPK2 family)